MGSGGGHVFCPRCGNPAYAEVNTRTMEESLSCRFCGYSAGTRIDWERWTKGQPNPKHEHYEHKTAGAYYIQNIRGGCESGHPVAKDNGHVDWGEVVDYFLEILKDPNVDSNASYLPDGTKKTRRS